jgi:hypothetical protein
MQHVIVGMNTGYATGQQTQFYEKRKRPEVKYIVSEDLNFSSVQTDHDAKKLWLQSQCVLAKNDNIPYMTVLACADAHIPKQKSFWDSIINHCLILDYDLRCIISCCTVALLTRKLLRTRNKDRSRVIIGTYKKVCNYFQKHTDLILAHAPVKPIKFYDMKFIPYESSDMSDKRGAWYSNDEYLWQDEYRYYFNSSLAGLELDKIGSVKYPYKCMGCAVWAARLVCTYAVEVRTKGLSVEKIILAVANECGDARNNCAVVGGILAAM